MLYDCASQVIKYIEDIRLPIKIVLDISSEISIAIGNIELMQRTFLIYPKDNAM